MAANDSTRDRIVAAATTEFSRHGIAGARVERIAKAAHTSKERVYAYFRSKDELYRFVATRELAAMAEAVPLNPADLPSYAAQVHDHVVAHPERRRLMRWGQLELNTDGSLPDDPFRVVAEDKIKQIRRAQKAGVVDKAWDPADVLVFVSQLATSWADQGDLIPAGPERDAFLTSRRHAIESAVRQLFPASID